MRGATYTIFFPEYWLMNFYSHAPCGARLRIKTAYNQESDFYSHAPCGARLMRLRLLKIVAGISTHTPHAGRDRTRLARNIRFNNFYSHAPCGARPKYVVNKSHGINFYSHAPCGARPKEWEHRIDFNQISTHTPHAGRDHIIQADNGKYWISTHTPHAGRDHLVLALLDRHLHFYSHAPCGARR